MTNMTTYNISLNPALARIVEREIKSKKYANRSEFFRSLLRRHYVEDEYVIEELSPDDPDYVLLQSRARNYKGDGKPIDEVIAEL